MKKRLLLCVTLCCCVGFAVQGQPITAEEALFLTGKSRYHQDVLAFYANQSMDTTRNYIHYLKTDDKLGIAFNPMDGYRTIFQVSIEKGHQGTPPLGLSWGMNEEMAARITSPSLIVSPKYLENQNETQSLVVKGGIAIILGFRNHELVKVYSIAATTPLLENRAAWQAAPYSLLKEGCIAGDCTNGVSVYMEGRNVHIGAFKNGEKDGYCQSFLEKGAFFHGKYSDGVRKEGVYFAYAGHRFSGKFDKDGQPDDGTLYYKNGDQFQGKIKDNKPVSGKMTHQSGDTFSGTFSENGDRLEGTLIQKGIGKFTGTFDEKGKPKTGVFTDLKGGQTKIVDGNRKN